MDCPFLAKIEDAKVSGKINDYMAEKLKKASEFGMTEQLLNDALEDAMDASSMGIDNDKDYGIRFYIVNLSDGILNDTFSKTIEPDRKEDLCRYALQVAKDEDFACDNLTDYRVLIHKWLCDKHDKKAYPNIQGKFEHELVYDTDKWTAAAREIYTLWKQKKLGKAVAINMITSEWDSDELFKFLNWLRYYESGNAEKYNVKTALKKEAIDFTDLNLPQHMLDPATRSNQRPPTVNERVQQKTQQEEKIEQATMYKKQMKSRLRALWRLLDKYNDLLPASSVSDVMDELYRLDKSISMLNVYASMQDRTILAANRMSKFGFERGAEFLKKVAEEPPEAMPEDPAPEAGSNQEVVRSIPEPVTSPNPEVANPEALVNVQTIISRLEGVGKKLKSRDTIRELASIDILLNELGMSSYFPEITDAQSKLIEAYGYASNKIESIAAKLRGSGTTGAKKPAQAPEAPKQQLDANELRSKPVGNVEKQLPTG